jgi:thiamine-phosphate pyrophosphorylase
MHRRQTVPKQWLIVRDVLEEGVIRRLPRNSGILMLRQLDALELRRLRRWAEQRSLMVVEERRGVAARVHNLRELTRASIHRTRHVLISPIYPTQSHPGWQPLGRMRAATLARLTGRRAIALGGMDARRFTRVQPLGFVAWAGISSWLDPTPEDRDSVKLRNLGP